MLAESVFRRSHKATHNYISNYMYYYQAREITPVWDLADINGYLINNVKKSKNMSQTN
jgi:hypothetical protein